MSHSRPLLNKFIYLPQAILADSEDFAKNVKSLFDKCPNYTPLRKHLKSESEALQESAHHLIQEANQAIELANHRENTMQSIRLATRERVEQTEELYMMSNQACLEIKATLDALLAKACEINAHLLSQLSEEERISIEQILQLTLVDAKKAEDLLSQQMALRQSSLNAMSNASAELKTIENDISSQHELIYQAIGAQTSARMVIESVRQASFRLFSKPQLEQNQELSSGISFARRFSV